MSGNTKNAGISDAAVQAKTGKTWPEWFDILDRAGAAAWPHKEIAIYLHDRCGCSDWWSQMVTVGYEQARGLRVKHQTTTGFSASASKTVAVPVSILYRAWHDPSRLAKWLPDGKKMTIRKATANRSLRATWIDGSTNVDVGFSEKGDAKSQVAVEHSKLGNVDEVWRIKAYWGAALLKLKTMLENAGSDGRASTATGQPRRRVRARGRQSK
jgi:hypothetical protein